jgi:tetratricopeptide (TPR) repeat protein
LDDATQSYQNALQVQTKADWPTDWANTQAALGLVLDVEGERASGDKALALFSQAMTDYQNALQVRTRADLPQDWALTQIALGDVLQDEAGRASGAEAETLFNQASQAYQSALEVVSKVNLSRAWAGGQLSLALISLDTSHFDTCVEHFGQITDGLLPPRDTFREDALRFLCEWGAGNKSAARETEKNLLSKSADATPFFWDASTTVSLLSNSPAFATGRDSWIAFFNSFYNGDGTGMTAALHQLEPLLQQ